MGVAEDRTKIMQLQDAVDQLPDINIPTAHYFTDNGIYVRQVFMPGDSYVVGAIHKCETINIISMGVVKIFNPEQPGQEDKIYMGPVTFKSPPGSKRGLYVMRDTIWSTVHRVDEFTDLESLRNEITVRNYDELTHDEKVAIGAEPG